MTLRRDSLPGRPAPAAGPQRPARAAGSAGSVLAVQQMAGNRATAQLLARQAVKTDPPPLDAHDDLALALDYVNQYYAQVVDLIELKDKVADNAQKNAHDFGDLKDPPSISDAVVAEIFSQVVSLIPGGKLVTAAITAGVFTLELAKLEAELREYPIPGVSVEDEHKKGPSEHTKAKVEKAVGHAKDAYDKGKAVIGAGIKAAEDQAAASKAEAAAKEEAAMRGKRVGDWREAITLARTQQKAIKGSLELAARKGTDRGKLKEIVAKRLGPPPELTAKLQQELERHYELELYKRKLTIATETEYTYYNGVSGRRTAGSSTALELVDGGKPSQAMLRRIAELVGQPWMWIYPFALAGLLGIGHSSREKYVRPYGLDVTRPGLGG